MLTALIGAGSPGTPSPSAGRPSPSRSIRRKASRRPVPAQVQGRAMGTVKTHRRRARPHQGAGHRRDHPRGRRRCSPTRRSSGWSSRSSSPAMSRASIRCCPAPISACCRRPRRASRKHHFVGKEDPPILQAVGPGHDLQAADQADRLDQPRLADLLPRPRGRHRARLGSRRPGAASHDPRLRAGAVRQVCAR